MPVRRDLTGYTYELEGWGGSSSSGVFIGPLSPSCMAEKTRYEGSKDGLKITGGEDSSKYRGRQTVLGTTNLDLNGLSRSRTSCLSPVESTRAKVDADFE